MPKPESTEPRGASQPPITAQRRSAAFEGVLIALAVLLALLAIAGPAQASGRDVIDDCTDDEILTKTYTQKEYRDALATLPADADQYGNCRDIIARAQDGAATKGGAKKTDTGAAAAPGGGTPGSGGPSVAPAKEQLAAASPEDRAAVQQATATDAVPGDPVLGRVGTAPGSSVADLPVPILVLLALLLAGALALGAVRLRSLVHTRRA